MLNCYCDITDNNFANELSVLTLEGLKSTLEATRTKEKRKDLIYSAFGYEYAN